MFRVRAVRGLLARCVALLVMGGGTAFAQGTEAASPPRVVPPARVEARSILRLAPEEAGLGIPCTLTGVVTCSSSRGELLFIQDATAGVYVYHTRDLPTQGHRVRVQGRTDRGLFSPIVISDAIEDLGAVPLPPPQRVSIEEMASGRHDSQWVEVEGVVIRSDLDWGHLVMVLASGSARLEVRILDVTPGQRIDWADARVRVRGVAGTAYNPRRQLVGFHLLSQGTNLVEVLRAPLPDPFSAPLRSSLSLLAYSPEGASEHRVKLRGLVAWAMPGQPFSLRDEAGGVRVWVHGPSADTLRPGDLVEAAGFAAPTLSRPELREAVVRVVGRGELPPAKTLTPRDAVAGLHEDERVVVEAQVLQAGERHERHSALVVESGGHAFRVRYPTPWGLGDRSDLVGSTVRVTGLCRQDSSASGTPGGFSIWLQDAGDLEVLRRSRGWWQRILTGVLSSLVGAVGLGALALVVLRRQVRRQTAALRARETALERRFSDLFENSNDLILGLDLEGRVVAANAAVEAVFGVSRERLENTQIEAWVDPLDVPVFRALRRSLLEGRPRTHHELRFRMQDGRAVVLDVLPRLQYDEGTVVGLQIIARDVTSRRAVEDALRSSEQQLRASLRERERLGRALHDGIIQSIYAVGLSVEGCRHQMQPLPAKAEECITRATGELNRIIREVRQFIAGLEQHPISGAEFKVAVETLAMAFGTARAPAFRMNLDDRAARLLSPLQATELLDLVREAVSNAVRHAAAASVTLGLEEKAGVIRLEIADDGIGFDAQSAAGQGRGLRNMATRADRLGAAFRLESRAGQGTRVVVSLTLSPAQSPS